MTIDGKLNGGKVLMKALRALAGQNELIGYFLLAYGFSWVVGVPLALEAQGVIHLDLPFSLHYLYAYGPALAALFMTWLVNGRDGLKDLFSRIIKWRVRPIWWIVAFSPLWLFALVAVVRRVIEGSWQDFNLLGQVHFLQHLYPGTALLLWIFTFGLGEEIGWRGFALPRLQRNRSALAASLILTILWALWHWPMFFYNLDSSFIIGWLLSLAAGTIVFTWLYNSSRGSVLILLLWHGSFDFITASNAGEGLAAIILSVIVMIWAIVVVLLYKPATLSAEQKQVI